MGTRLEGSYELELGEFYRALRWYAWKKYWWLYCILIFLVTISLLGSILRHVNDSHSQGLLSDAEVVVIPILLAGLFQWSVYRGAQRQYKTNYSLREPRHYIFSENGLESSSSSSAGKLSWTSFHKVIETPEMFLFFTSSVGFIVVPKRSLAGEEQVQELRTLISPNLGTKAKLRRN
jgi:YcxB-like protein